MQAPCFQLRKQNLATANLLGSSDSRAQDENEWEIEKIEENFGYRFPQRQEIHETEGLAHR